MICHGNSEVADLDLDLDSDVEMIAVNDLESDLGMINF